MAPFNETVPFLADFGEDVQFGDVVFRGIVDAPGRDVGISGAAIIGADWSVTYSVDDQPGLKSGDLLMIRQQRFRIREVMPIDDGIFARASLVRLGSANG